jgi:hypothetical protein
VGFAVVPPGPYAYQNAYWIEPDALQAQAVAPNHIADAHAQQHNQQVIAQEAQAEEALNVEHNHGLPLAAPNHIADAHVQQENQQEGNQAQVALNVEHNHGLPLANTPRGCRPYQELQSLHLLGPLDIMCRNCRAMHFMSEKLTKSSQRNPKFDVCCLQGQIQLPAFPELPPLLHHLYTGWDEPSRHFRDKIRRYNMAFAFTSLGVKLDQRIIRSTGPYAFKIHGALSHRLGGLLPLENEPAFAQLYIYDPNEALSHRQRGYNDLLPGVLGDLQNILYAINPYVPLYRQAYEILSSKPREEQDGCAAQIVVAPNTDIRRYNLPTSVEVAAIIPGSGNEDIQEHREVILRLRQHQADDPTRNNLIRISHLHPLYTPLHYVLLFPRGEIGWHLGIPTIEVEETCGQSATIS